MMKSWATRIVTLMILVIGMWWCNGATSAGKKPLKDLETLKQQLRNGPLSAEDQQIFNSLWAQRNNTKIDVVVPMAIESTFYERYRANVLLQKLDKREQLGKADFDELPTIFPPYLEVVAPPPPSVVPEGSEDLDKKLQDFKLQEQAEAKVAAAQKAQSVIKAIQGPKQALESHGVMLSALKQDPRMTVKAKLRASCESLQLSAESQASVVVAALIQMYTSEEKDYSLSIEERRFFNENPLLIFGTLEEFGMKAARLDEDVLYITAEQRRTMRPWGVTAEVETVLFRMREYIVSVKPQAVEE